MELTTKQAHAIIAHFDAEATLPRKKADAVAAADAALRANKMVAQEQVAEDATDLGDLFLVAAPERAAPAGADASITVLAEANPKREGSSAHARFALYKKAKTVGEYIDACVAAGHERRKARLDLRHDIEHGYIAIA